MAFLQYPPVAPMPLLLLLQSIVFKIIIIINLLSTISDVHINTYT